MGHVDVAGVRLLLATRWLRADPHRRGLPVGYFGRRAAATAAILAAAEDPTVAAVVALDGRPDLVASRLPALRAPTLLIVGSPDLGVLEANLSATRSLACPHEVVVDDEDRSHRSRRAASWFARHLSAARAGDRR